MGRGDSPTCTVMDGGVQGELQTAQLHWNLLDLGTREERVPQLE